MLVSYIDNKNCGKKNVIVLSTIQENVKVTKYQGKKPQVDAITITQKVDVVDLLSTSHSSRVKPKKMVLEYSCFYSQQMQIKCKDYKRQQH